MRPVLLCIALFGAVVALSGPQSPAPVEASSVSNVGTSHIQDAAIDALKAEIESLRAELAQAKSAPSPAVPVAAVSRTTASGGAVCANGSCGVAAAPVRRVFAAESRRFQPVRRLFGRRR